MRIFLHIAWFLAAYIVFTIILTLIGYQFVDPSSKESAYRIGGIVGNISFYALFVCALAVWLASRRGWLPGLRKR
ncbi:hypothetical protein [Lysobacter sp. FW306-1B-D06B]|uniref:hypothetical protein n=1 Tax=Lysobacter sp. FW306-1B-D06B TaxID=3140250 RepID=UPI00314082ED